MSASWDSSAQDALLNYSSRTTEKLWDGLDGSTVALNLNWAATGGCAILKSDTNGPYTPPGMMEVNLSAASCGYVGVVNITGAQDWSQVDRLVLWVFIPPTLQSPSFNLTARVGLAGYSTRAEPLVYGAQQVVVDLNQLGVSRASLSSVTLRFNFQSVVTPTSIYVDDLRIAEAKVFNETASVSQLVAKQNLTSQRPGSALLSFDWSAENESGAVRVGPTVNISGGSQAMEIPVMGSQEAWHHFAADVSSVTGAAGIYNLSFRLNVVVNNTERSNVTFRVDNVSLFFPNRTSGTYLSNVTPLGADSQFLQVAWSATLPLGTGIDFQVRTGNTANGAGAGWSSWSNWTAPGAYVVILPGNPYFQARAELTTTNASLTPALTSLVLEARYRVASGSVASVRYTAPADLLRWDTVSVNWSGAMSTSLALYLGNGTYWTQWALNDNISSYAGRTIAWRVVLGTQDGLQTPLLFGVNLTYEYLGRFQAVTITPSGTIRAPLGTWVHLTATALDAGGHVNNSAYFVWYTTDPANKVFANNSVQGSYYAATTGNWTVSAFAQGTSYHDTVVVRVTSGGNGSVISPDSWVFMEAAVIILVAAALGFVVYELEIRRMFAIDDVFLISKDGRLIMHNTRRMRADRDEDILSGMLTAIMAFLRDQDPEENGELKRFQVGGKTTLLDRGDHIYLAAVYSGRVPGWAGKDMHRFVEDLEREFGEAFETWTGSPEDLYALGLKPFMERFVSRVRYHSTSHGIGRAS